MGRHAEAEYYLLLQGADPIRGWRSHGSSKLAEPRPPNGSVYKRKDSTAEALQPMRAEADQGMQTKGDAAARAKVT